ncbi:hypothetical protein [Desulfurobacterium sp.]
MRYENYIPKHLDDPKYVGNFELKKVGIILFSGIFSAVWIFSGSFIQAALLIAVTVLYFKYEMQYADFLPGYLYWTLGLVALSSKQRQRAEKFGLVPTYIRDFVE